MNGYTNNEHCEIVASRQLYATATAFRTENSYDVVVIGSARYSGTHGPRNVLMASGATMAWQTDGSIYHYDGFRICATA